MILDTAKYLGKCDCGRDHELRTKLVVCEYGALNNFDKYMEDCGLGGFRTVIYDTNTYNLPTMVHVKADQEIILEAQGLHSEKGMIEDMMTQLTRKPDVIVVVGAGTLMDFGRYSAYKLGIPFVAIPTLVSSDGFTANICSIIIDGQKKSIPMIAPDAVICDLDIVKGAPRFLTVSGVQDILSKYVSIADWKIAHLVSGEYFCQRVCDMAQEALDTMVTIICAEEYHRLAQRENIEVKPFQPLDPAWVRDIFGDLADGIFKECENDVLAGFDEHKIQEHWQEIREIIAAIPSAEELTELFKAIGAKHSLSDLGIDESMKHDALDISAAIRNRLTFNRMRRLIVD